MLTEAKVSNRTDYGVMRVVETAMMETQGEKFAAAEAVPMVSTQSSDAPAGALFGQVSWIDEPSLAVPV